MTQPPLGNRGIYRLRFSGDGFFVRLHSPRRVVNWLCTERRGCADAGKAEKSLAEIRRDRVYALAERGLGGRAEGRGAQPREGRAYPSDGCLCALRGLPAGGGECGRAPLRPRNERSRAGNAQRGASRNGSRLRGTENPSAAKGSGRRKKRHRGDPRRRRRRGKRPFCR